MKWAPQAIPAQACHCPSKNNKLQDKEMCAQRCGGESEVAVGQLTLHFSLRRAGEDEQAQNAGVRQRAGLIKWRWKKLNQEKIGIGITKQRSNPVAKGV